MKNAWIMDRKIKVGEGVQESDLDTIGNEFKKVDFFNKLETLVNSRDFLGNFKKEI